LVFDDITVEKGKSLVKGKIIYSVLFIEFPFVYVLIGFVVLTCAALPIGKGR